MNKRPLSRRIGRPLNEPEPIEVDQIVLVCNGCRGETTVYPDRPLRGAQEVIEWLRTKPRQCACGATTCNVKAHIRNAEAAGLSDGDDPLEGEPR